MTYALAHEPSDVLTGPSPAHQRDLNQVIPPYSIKIGNQYVSYKDLEMARVALGTAAGFRDVIAGTDWDSTDGNEEAGKAMTAAMAVYGHVILDSNLMFQSANLLHNASSTILDGNPKPMQTILTQYLQMLLNTPAYPDSSPVR